jgi:hypothetical protein
MSTTSTTPIKKRGVFIKRNDPEINYGQTGEILFTWGVTDEQCFFSPDGEQFSFNTPSWHLAWEGQDNYFWGLDADSRGKNLRDAIFKCK